MSEPRSEPSEPALPQVIDTRRYRSAIGIFGVLLVLAFSVYLFVNHGSESPGVAPGKRIPLFVAPLATSALNRDANASPRCDPARPNPDGLNVCGRSPLVLGLFVTGSVSCERQIDTIQAVSRQFAGRDVQFGAVAVNASHARAAGLVRSHRWTIPVAYDRDGVIGSVYDVALCPMVELAYRGGVVAYRLIGNHWLSEAALAARVRVLLRSSHGP
ncbi:MAG: hypothetical protein WBP81_19440 [Solirubrobacteraceae bacterium]